jgi:p-aminobenzoyl-glutamate transporter AbgT|tara:strand:+ start:94 stop:450 length:357 start_codon:yes stop_codon:yes gene_type:complete
MKELSPLMKRKAAWATVRVYAAVIAGVLLFPYVANPADGLRFHVPTTTDIVALISMLFLAPGILFLFFERKGETHGKLKNSKTRTMFAFILGLAGHGITGKALELGVNLYSDFLSIGG